MFRLKFIVLLFSILFNFCHCMFCNWATKKRKVSEYTTVVAKKKRELFAFRSRTKTVILVVLFCNYSVSPECLFVDVFNNSLLMHCLILSFENGLSEITHRERRGKRKRGR